MSLSCSHWNEKKSKWESACQVSPDSTSSKLHCECKQLSALAGLMKQPVSHLDEVFQLDFKMGTETCYIVTIVSMAVILIYIILLTLNVFWKENDLLKVFFLSDVLPHERYMYLLAVKTGSRLFAGTTSNVMIKLTGTQAESTEHVLNFPDPYKDFLNRGNDDWFVLATEKHLGDLKKLDLWFDHIGFSPTWYCTEIMVYDFQLYKFWYFAVNKWFRVLNPPNTHMEVFCNPVAEDMEKKWKNLPKILSMFGRSTTWRIFTSGRDNRINYLARVTVMFSIMLTMFAITFFFYCEPSILDVAAFSPYSEFEVHSDLIMITFLSPACTYALHIVWIYFFRNSCSRYEKRHRARYSHRVRKICWTILIANITIWSLLMPCFGLSMPYVSSLLWLAAVILGLILYIAVLENLAFLAATRVQDKVREVFTMAKSIIEQVEYQRAKLYKMFGAVLLRPYFEHLYKQIDHIQLKEKQMKQILRREMLGHFEDLVMFAVYLVIMYLLIFVSRSEDFRYSNKQMAMILEGKFANTGSYKGVSSFDDFCRYIEKSFLTSLQTTTWYGKYVISNPGMLIDMSNKYLGVARLRQHRAVKNACKVHPLLRFINPECVPEYSTAPDTGSYDRLWTHEPENRTISRLDSIWKYAKPDYKTGVQEITGSVASYPGGGYILPLGRNLKNSLINFEYIKDKGWFDNATRCVIVEFLAYSANSNLFNAVFIILETSASGTIRALRMIDTVKLLLSEDEVNLSRVILLAAFVVILAILTVRNVSLLIRKRGHFFKDIWRIIDTLIIVNSVTCLCLIIHRRRVMEIFIQQLQDAKNNAFLDYFYIFLAQNALTASASFLIFIATVRLWKLLRFRHIFRLMERTILWSGPTIICLVFYYFIIVCSCMFLILEMLGGNAIQFSDASMSMMSLLLMTVNMLKDLDMDAIRDAPFGVGYFFYVFFSFCSIFVTTMMVGIIIYYYQVAQLSFSSEGEKYNLQKYLQEECGYFKTMVTLKLKAMRLRSGEDREVSYVTPKADEHRYANFVTGSKYKMFAMEYITRCYIRNKLKDPETRKLSKYDEVLAKKVLAYRYAKDEEDEFFFTIYNNKRVKIVADTRIELMSSIADLLLTPPDQRASKTLSAKQQKNQKTFEYFNQVLETHLDVLKNISFKRKQDVKKGVKDVVNQVIDNSKDPDADPNYLQWYKKIVELQRYSI